MNEKQSFEFYYDKYYRQVYLYVYKKLLNLHDAEDLTQEAFVSAYQKFDSFDPQRASFQTWIFVIVGNKLKNHYRDRKTMVDLDDPDQYEEPFEESFENEMVEAEYLSGMRNMLADALETLNQTQRTIVVDSYFKNRSSKEIAADLGMTDGNVRVQLSRAIKRMRQWFDENQIEWEL